MNSIASPVVSSRVDDRSFYVWLGVGFLLVAFSGFIPTYWSPVLAGKFKGPPFIHIHGALMFLWTCFFLLQTTLVASGRTLNHRAWGLAGISFFTVIACAIGVGEMAVLRRYDALGFGDAARRFAAVTLCALPMMIALFGLAIANVRRPQVHKRLMVVLMAGLMTPAIARVFLTVLAPPGAGVDGPPPAFVSIPPALVADLFIVVAMARDWRRLGAPHPAYVWAGAALLAQQVLTVPLSATAAWMSIANAFERLGG
jgi:hypothetical protein